MAKCELLLLRNKLHEDKNMAKGKLLLLRNELPEDKLCKG